MSARRSLPPASGAASLHQQILADIESRILSGEWPPGHRIPFEHELTAKYGCSRMTVSKALTQLAGAGLIERRRKAGSFVRGRIRNRRCSKFRTCAPRSKRSAWPIAMRSSPAARERASRADRTVFEVASTDMVLALRCRHDAAHQPFCLEERLINLSAAPEAADEPFASDSPGAWLVERVPWTSAEHRIRAGATRGETARALKIAEGAPCLVIERRTWSGDTPVTHVTLTYPGEAHELVARFKPLKV